MSGGTIAMEGRLLIDGNDAFAQWGVYAVQGGWNDLVAFPPLKTVTSNDWQEEDGIEADLSAPRLNTRECTVKFAYSKGADSVADLISVLSKGAYHDFAIKSLGRECSLRMTQVTAMTADGGDFGTVSIKLADDFPLDSYKYEQPDSDIPTAEDYFLDGVPLTDYGVRVLQGGLAELLKPPAVKQNLLRNLPHLAGAEYDGGRVTFKSKDIKLPCLMRAESMAALWRNRDALLYDLVRPGERILAVDALGQKFPCHYKQCAVSEFFPDGRPWLRFSLTLTLTRNLRINGTQSAAQAAVTANTAQTAQDTEDTTPTPETTTA